jgi:hypothetical protein
LMSKISAEQLRERFLLLYRENSPDSVNPYTKIQIENFLDKTSTGLAKQPSPAYPDGLAGTIIPVTGGGLKYEDATGKLSLEIPSDSLNFVGFISVNYQQADANLNAGDFYIVNVETVTLKVTDWPGIDDASTPVIDLTETQQGKNYRANTGTIGDLVAYTITNPDGGLKFSGDIYGGKLSSVSVTDPGTGYQVDTIVEVIAGASGGGGTGGLVRILGVGSSGEVTALEVYDPGHSFRLGVGGEGSLAPLAVDGGSGTGMIVTATIDGYGTPNDVTIVENGYGYQDGDVVTIPGVSIDSDESKHTVSITGDADVELTLGDRVFYKKDGTFVVVPDVVAANTILELLPDDPTGTFFFEDNPDPQHLVLNIKNANVDGGVYHNGLISAEDKEKLDNISKNAGQGRVYEIVTDDEPNYLDPTDPLADTLSGSTPLELTEYSMLNSTGNDDFVLETIGYRINVLSAQKLLVDNSNNTISPRNRGLVFLAERNEIEDIIEPGTIGSDMSTNTVINAEDTREFFTQKKFSTLPPYVDVPPASFGTISIVGPTELLEGLNTRLVARIEGSDANPNDISYAWTINDPAGAVTTQITDGNSIYIEVGDNVAGQTITVSVVATDTTGTFSDINASTIITLVAAPKYIGFIDVVSPPTGFRAKTYEEIDFNVVLGGDDATNDIEFIIEDLDQSAYDITHTAGDLTAKIKFFEPSTVDMQDTNDYIVTIRAYSDTAVDATETADDGRKYSFTQHSVIVDANVINPQIVQTDGGTPSVGGTSTFVMTYDGGASSDDVSFDFETNRSEPEVSSNDSNIFNMFDGDTNTSVTVDQMALTFEFQTTITDFNFKLMSLELVADEDTTLELYHTTNGVRSLIKTFDVTTDKQTLTAADNDVIVESGEFELALGGSDAVSISMMNYDGSPMIKYPEDIVSVDSNTADITFGSPGDVKIMGHTMFNDNILNTELDLTIN